MTLRSVAALPLALALAACGGAPPAPVTAPGHGELSPVSDGPVSEAPPAPMSPEVQKGAASLDAGDMAGAKTHFQAALAQNPKDADAMYFLGSLAERAGDLAGAEASYKASLAARPGFAGAEVNLSALYDDAQRYDEALAVTTPSLGEHPREGSLHLNAAIAYGGKKEAPAAIREFEAAIGIAPQNPTFRLVYGHWLAVFGQRSAAVAQIMAGVPGAAGNLGVLAALGHELHVLGAFTECVSVFGQATAQKDAAELVTERAACKIGLKDDAGAIADLRAATAKEPGYAPAHYYLGSELAKTGDPGGAVTEWQAFLKLEPTGPLAKAVGEKIKLAKQRR